MVGMSTTIRASAATTFRMTVINADGTTAEGTFTEAEAARSLTTATRRGYDVEVLPNGGANISRRIGAGGYHTVRIVPMRKAGNLTATARMDLRLIASRHIAVLVRETGCVKAGYLNSIPPGATARLMAQGLVTVTGATVTVSLSARLAMLAQDNRPAPWSYTPSVGELLETVATATNGLPAPDHTPEEG
jgi:hypothetical protein